MRLLTVSANDLSRSSGPAIHFMELWNAVFRLRPEWELKGLAPACTVGMPVRAAQFDLDLVPAGKPGLVRSLVFDLAVSLRILSGGYSLVYLRFATIRPFTLLVLRLKRVPVIVELNGIVAADSASSGRGRIFTALANRLERSHFRRADAAIAVSDSVAEHARREGVSRVTTIANGVSRDRLKLAQKSVSDRPQIVFVSGFYPWDGAFAVVDLARSFPRVDFLMVGDGDCRDQVEQSAPPNVQFIGSVPYETLAGIYEATDAGIALYEVEKHAKVTVSSLKTLEYVASGLPVFATRIPGQEFLQNEAIGVVTEAQTGGDCCRDFEAFLAKLPTLKRNCDAYRKERGWLLTWDRVAAETCSIIEELVGDYPDGNLLQHASSLAANSQPKNSPV